MKLIAAVYEDWGIGAKGTQPIALNADRKFFRAMTKGCDVLVGRRTVADFPGGKPLPGRKNILLTRGGGEFPGFTVVHTPAEAMAAAGENAYVIGGGSVYAALLPLCDTAVITKVHVTPESDTFLPNLDESPDWVLSETLDGGEENGIAYEMVVYRRK